VNALWAKLSLAICLLMPMGSAFGASPEQASTGGGISWLSMKGIPSPSTQPWARISARMWLLAPLLPDEAGEQVMDPATGSDNECEARVFTLKLEDDMPFIQVKLIENVFSLEQKQQLITRITDAFIEVEGEHIRPVTFVVIDETRSGNWGIGGKLMTTEAVRALAPVKKSVA
jgi:4-oxalocrotonate tautomerase